MIKEIFIKCKLLIFDENNLICDKENRGGTFEKNQIWTLQG